MLWSSSGECLLWNSNLCNSVVFDSVLTVVTRAQRHHGSKRVQLTEFLENICNPECWSAEWVWHYDSTYCLWRTYTDLIMVSRSWNFISIFFWRGVGLVLVLNGHNKGAPKLTLFIQCLPILVFVLFCRVYKRNQRMVRQNCCKTTSLWKEGAIMESVF